MVARRVHRRRLRIDWIHFLLVYTVHAPVHNELTVPWHFVFESLAYFVPFRLYLLQRRKARDFIYTSTRWTLVAAAVARAAILAKVLFCFLPPPPPSHPSH